MADAPEQNRSEAPTPFKLQKAREKGQVARSPELGFLAGLLALIGFVSVAGPALVATLAQAMRIALSSGFAEGIEPAGAAGLLARLYGTILSPLLLLGGTLVGIVILLELIQLRGFVLTFHPLKPDWSRLNPAKGLKRLFTLRMLKETLKSLAKFAAYAAATWVVVRGVVTAEGQVAGDGERIATLLHTAGLRLAFAFLLVAVVFAILDQLLVRREFTRQMRMSRREVTREHREREGEPRIKQRRKQLHREMTAQGKGSVAGSDLLIVNPEHFAVALRYDDAAMTAPEVAAKGRGEHALNLRREAGWRGIPIVADPPLARALFRACTIGATIPGDRFEAVAAHYIALRRAQAAERT
ncbi:EscU/YscU/HrcU family type III secretion system export apparatus switch protein [Sphingomonas sp. VNH70]|uniref:EscU/YscU/HrcU family type III secretion system export apparatus switch protein n=1 Tax=Sphingomonas silueang TaxID=3156617 RepID=UPI0032B4882B